MDKMDQLMENINKMVFKKKKKLILHFIVYRMILKKKQKKESYVRGRHGAHNYSSKHGR